MIKLPAPQQWTVTLALLLGIAIPVSAEPKRAPPPFEGESVPIPPEQRKAWSPPAIDLPETLLSATDVLFRQGLADPRGCDYRVIEIGTSSVWAGDGGIVTTHGWVLPIENLETQRFAVCWNGLVYPVVTVGERSDVERDIRALLDADEKYRAERQKSRPDDQFVRWLRAYPEAESLSHQSLLPIKVCLLLRLGHGDLAQEVWAAWISGVPPRVNDKASQLRDPYLLLARDWAWALFDRAVCAHMRGDDHLSRLTASMVAPIHKAIEAEATRRGFERRGDALHVSFLNPIDRLLKDQQRRAKQRDVERVLVVGIEKFPDPAKRIAALICNLEEASAGQWGQPGGVDLSMDKIVEALIHEGEPAVEPLIDCLEHDERLTRSVQFHRDFFTHRELIGVDEAAYRALSKILEARTFGPHTKNGYSSTTDRERRQKVATEIRGVWEQSRGEGPAERWYRLLLNDEGDPRQWVEAATRIVEPVRNKDRFTKPQGKPALQGEKLRDQRTPSVADLMIRRAETLAALGRPGSEQRFNLHSACKTALALSEWDADASLPTLRKLIEGCRREIAGAQQADSWTVQILAVYIAQMTLAAADAGEHELLSKYAEWIQTTAPESLDGYASGALEPLWRYGIHPQIAAAAEWMFDNERSPWFALHQSPISHGARKLDELIRSPLLGLPSFRHQILREFKNTDAYGTVEVGERGSLSIHLDGSQRGTRMRFRDDPLAPAQGTKTEFRVCDYYAWILSTLPGTPLVELYWPRAERDQAVKQYAAFLERWGERFGFSEDHPPERAGTSGVAARLVFPRLSEPASKDDVDAGRAIFSLTTDQQVRMVRLDPFPIRARWTTLKDFPLQVETVSTETGEREWVTRYEQEGTIWQAEEVLENSKWVRYYGFVGRHIIARVPASEIELLD